jgi:hypothetical protein
MVASAVDRETSRRNQEQIMAHRKNRRVAALLLVLGGIATVAPSLMPHAQAAPATQAAQVEEIRVQLFREISGTFSEDVIATGEGFWNVIIAEDPADAFLVTVVVRGKPDEYDRKAFVTIGVFDDKTGKKLAERSYRGGLLFRADGRRIKPFMVYDQTCTPIRITARSNAGAKTVKVPFRCGE